MTSHDSVPFCGIWHKSQSQGHHTAFFFPRNVRRHVLKSCLIPCYESYHGVFWPRVKKIWRKPVETFFAGCCRDVSAVFSWSAEWWYLNWYEVRCQMKEPATCVIHIPKKLIKRLNMAGPVVAEKLIEISTANQSTCSSPTLKTTPSAQRVLPPHTST